MIDMYVWDLWLFPWPDVRRTSSKAQILSQSFVLHLGFSLKAGPFSGDRSQKILEVYCVLVERNFKDAEIELCVDRDLQSL